MRNPSSVPTLLLFSSPWNTLGNGYLWEALDMQAPDCLLRGPRDNWAEKPFICPRKCVMTH